jgi:hypothetical protein
MIVVTEAKDNVYHDWFLTYMVFPLAIKIFRFLHKQVSSSMC